MHAYGSLQREKVARDTFAVTFYHKKIKTKLLRGLHETNLEFIRTQIHLEQYYVRKRQRVFFNKIRVMTEFNRSLNKLNPFIISMLLLWASSIKMNSLKHLHFKSKATKVILGAVVRAWRQRIQSVKKFKNNIRMRKML